MNSHGGPCELVHQLAHIGRVQHHCGISPQGAAQKAMAIRCEACLALNADRPTEPANIS